MGVINNIKLFFTAMPLQVKKILLLITITLSLSVALGCILVSFWFILILIGFFTLIFMAIQSHANFLKELEIGNQKIQAYADELKKTNNNVETFKITQKQYEEFHKKGFTLIEGKHPLIFSEANKIGIKNGNNK
jgi:fatty acid desaturase